MPPSSILFCRPVTISCTHDFLLSSPSSRSSIFKRFRYVQRSDELYSVILFTLNGIQAPLLSLFKSIGQAVDALANDRAQLLPRFEALRLIARIFYSLNYQDLPEFFEDHMKEWMTDFAKYLQYQNALLVDPEEENEPSPIDLLQAAIIKNLQLYADKDEEPFLPYLPEFATLVWNLLVNVTALPKHDALATTSIRFLSSLVQKLMHKHLFQDEATLRQIVGKIVIPNLMFRESDQERFEDDPREYIVSTYIIAIVFSYVPVLAASNFFLFQKSKSSYNLKKKHIRPPTLKVRTVRLVDAAVKIC